MYKLLIVDDSFVQIRSIQSFINWEDFGVDEIKTAQNGSEGLSVFQEFQPDIVITDVVMPIMDGILMTKEIRKIKPSTKFIYISCHDDFGYLSDAMKNNVYSYILKPIDAKLLSENILKVIEEIEKENKFKSMNKLFQESMDVFRENFLYNMLYSSHVDTGYFKDTLSNLGFQNYSVFLVAKFEITEGVEDYLQTYNLLKFAKQTIFEDIAGYIVPESKYSLAAIFMTDTFQDFTQKVKANLKEFNQNVTEKYSIHMNIGLSNIHTSLYEARFMLSQANSALENRATCDEDGIYTYENFEYAPIHIDILDLKNAISDLLEHVSSDEIHSFVDKYYPVNVRLSNTYIKSLCVSTMTTLQLLMIERNLDISNLFGSSAVVWNKLDKMQTIQDIRQWLYNMLAMILEYIRDNDTNKYQKIISEIMEHINQHYREISNIEQIVSDLYISASYAKSIFKKYTGKTIFDYLLSRRMEEAKKLLSDPYIKVYEVAEMVGYNSKAHFTETFRRYTGQTPNEYQKKGKTDEKQ